MSDEVLAQARRLHHHVMNGGNVTAMDMSRLVQGMERMQAERDQLREALRDIVEAWDWWQRDTVDRCQSVPGEAIAHARAALGEDRA